MQGQLGFAVHGRCRGLHRLHVFQITSNRSCACCWCPDSQLDDTQSTCKYRRAKDVFAQLDALLEQLLDDEGCVLRGKPEAVTETEGRLKHKLILRNAWRLIEYFALLMSCPKDEVR